MHDFHEFRFVLTLVAFATAMILIGLHVFVPIPKKGSLDSGDTSIQRRIDARRAELARFASLTPNSTTSIIVQPSQPCHAPHPTLAGSKQALG